MSLDVSLKVPVTEMQEVFSYNITHNLGEMAREAGIYEYLWRPEEIGITEAHELIGPLKAGLEWLTANSDVFKKFNPANGWGDYSVLVEFVGQYIEACEMNPHATVCVDR